MQSFCGKKFLKISIPIVLWATNRHVPSNKPENFEEFCQSALGKPDLDPFLVFSARSTLEPLANTVTGLDLTIIIVVKSLLVTNWYRTGIDLVPKIQITLIYLCFGENLVSLETESESKPGLSESGLESESHDAGIGIRSKIL